MEMRTERKCELEVGHDTGKEVVQRLMPVRRNWTDTEKARRQLQLYSPCSCGSSLKFKFCCYKQKGDQ